MLSVTNVDHHAILQPLACEPHQGLNFCTTRQEFSLTYTLVHKTEKGVLGFNFLKICLALVLEKHSMEPGPKFLAAVAVIIIINTVALQPPYASV